MKYRGWAAFAEYMDRCTDDPVTVSPDGEFTAVQTGYGVNMQLSYILPNNIEFAGRYTFVNPESLYYQTVLPSGEAGSPVLISAPGTEEYTLGITKYLDRHKIKAQGNIGYRITENPSPGEVVISNWFIRFQVELGI